MQIQFLSKTRILGYGTTQLRCVQPAEYLNARGWTCGVGCLFRSVPRASQAIVFHRASTDPQTIRYLDYADGCGLVKIYDIDDLLFDEAAIQHLTSVTRGNGKRTPDDPTSAYRAAMNRCDVVLASTDFLVEKARTFHGDVRIVRNGLSRDFATKADRVYVERQNRNRQGTTIGYLSGSSHHDEDFELVRGDLWRTMEDQEDVKLLLVGKIREPEEFRRFGERFEVKPFIPYAEFINIFGEIDINIAPLLVDNAFEQARSEVKYTEAGACGVPTIASPTRTYSRAIQHNRNGLIASEGEWLGALRLLTTDSQCRRRLGEAARRDVMENYGPARREEEWNSLMHDILLQYKPLKKQAGYWERRRLATSARYACAKRWAYIGWRNTKQVFSDHKQ